MFNNGLTPIEVERLAKLSSECGELVQIIGKIHMHGKYSAHPDNPSVTNNVLLEEECADVYSSIMLLEEIGLLSMERVKAIAKDKRLKVNKWLHFETDNKEGNDCGQSK